MAPASILLLYDHFAYRLDMLQLARRNKLMYTYIYSGSGEIGKAITANLSSTVAFLLIIISERRASISQDYYLPGDDRTQQPLLCLLRIRGRRPQLLIHVNFFLFNARIRKHLWCFCFLTRVRSLHSSEELD